MSCSCFIGKTVSYSFIRILFVVAFSNIFIICEGFPENFFIRKQSQVRERKWRFSWESILIWGSREWVLHKHGGVSYLFLIKVEFSLLRHPRNILHEVTFSKNIIWYSLPKISRLLFVMIILYRFRGKYVRGLVADSKSNKEYWWTVKSSFPKDYQSRYFSDSISVDFIVSIRDNLNSICILPYEVIV